MTTEANQGPNQTNSEDDPGVKRMAQARAHLATLRPVDRMLLRGAATTYLTQAGIITFGDDRDPIEIAVSLNDGFNVPPGPADTNILSESTEARSARLRRQPPYDEGFVPYVIM